MPGKVKVRILAGRNLPVMDKSSDTSDAFAEVKLGNTTYKTEVFRRSLNPYWNSEWFRFEADDEDLQDEPLQIRIMDYDTYSANDAIGKVYIDLNPLLHKDSGHIMFGWFPIYDTMHGIRGEVHLAVKVDLFSDSNRYRQSSCGVRFFYSPSIPHGYICQAILGFVEELVVNDDPEYQWIDKIRTPRASNEARQTLFSKLSGEVQRKIGLKALDLGGNAVIGYKQNFDLEGESGIVVRGIGTAVLLSKIEATAARSRHGNLGSISAYQKSEELQPPPPPLPHLSMVNAMQLQQQLQSHTSVEEQMVNTKSSMSVSSSTPPPGQQSSEANIRPSTPLTAPPVLHSGFQINSAIVKNITGTTSPVNANNLINRRGSSDPDLSLTPNCGSIPNSSGSGSAGKSFKFIISPEGFHLLEYPFITMKMLPTGLIQHIGGAVSSRSVKLLDQVNNPDDPETRDTWWMELRKEVRSHCRALGCNSVIGYSESTNICEDVVILSASGTAAILNNSIVDNEIGLHVEKEKRDLEPVNTPPNKIPNRSDNRSQVLACDNRAYHHHFHGSHLTNCSLCHVPYIDSSISSVSSLAKCSVCKKGRVPEVLFMTIEPPGEIPITGIGCLIQARVCRFKRDTKGELCAKEISDSLPFLEYELHRQLLSKLKVKGMNSIFGLTVQISIGENLLTALATGTGAFISALPTPAPPQISSSKGIQTSKLNEIQKLINENLIKNRELYGLTQTSTVLPTVEAKGDSNHVEKEVNGVDNKTVINSSGSKSPNSLVNQNALSGNKSNVTNCAQNIDGEDLDKAQVLLEVDDTEDADIISLMIDSDMPEGYSLCNVENMPNIGHLYVCNLQTFSQVYRAKLNSNKQFGQQFDWIIQSLFVKLRHLVPCCLVDLKFRLDLPEADLVQLTVMGSVIGLGDQLHSNVNGKTILNLPQQCPGSALISSGSGSFRKRTYSISEENEELLFSMDEDSKEANDANNLNATNVNLLNNNNTSNSNSYSNTYHIPPTEHNGVELTSMSSIPDGKIHHYLGNLDFFFIRESTSIRESGGLNGFMHSFLSEVFAIVRAHVAALGGNAMTSLHLTQCVLLYNPHKNQSQCLINIAGDAVVVHYHNSKMVTSLLPNKLQNDISTNESINELANFESCVRL